MKTISIWQPFASLIVKGCKVYETRGWPAPASVIGQRIGIASTKSILPPQRSHYDAEHFRAFYEDLNLPVLDDLPHGFLLGTVILDSVNLMTEEFIDGVSREEQAYGWWTPGNYAWGLIDPFELAEPIRIRGAQGLYEWNGDLPDGALDKAKQREGSEVDGFSPDGDARSSLLRSHLRPV